MNKVGILFLHGIGEKKDGYADKMIEILERNTKNRIVTHSVMYGDVLFNDQEQMKQTYRTCEPRLKFSKIRDILIGYIGDAGALTNNQNPQGYNETQKLIKDGLRSLEGQLGRDATIIVVAHSLGCEVMSNYLWDAGRNQKLVVDPYCVKNIKGFVTMGCNIPLFHAGLDEVVPFKTPHEEFSWINYYSKYDVLGFPLEPLNEAYRDLVTDVDYTVGGLLTKYTPMCHTAYWEDKKFARLLAEVVDGF